MTARPAPLTPPNSVQRQPSTWTLDENFDAGHAVRVTEGRAVFGSVRVVSLMDWFREADEVDSLRAQLAAVRKLIDTALSPTQPTPTEGNES